MGWAIALPSPAAEMSDPRSRGHFVVHCGGRVANAIVPSHDRSSGIDLAYARQARSELRERCHLAQAGKSNMPDSVPAFAVGDGVVRYAGRAHHGFTLMLAHRNGWESFYTNLEH